jgi:hypothetical protein
VDVSTVELKARSASFATTRRRPRFHLAAGTSVVPRSLPRSGGPAAGRKRGPASAGRPPRRRPVVGSRAAPTRFSLRSRRPTVSATSSRTIACVQPVLTLRRCRRRFSADEFRCPRLSASTLAWNHWMSCGRFGSPTCIGTQVITSANRRRNRSITPRRQPSAQVARSHRRAQAYSSWMRTGHGPRRVVAGLQDGRAREGSGPGP